MNENAFVFRFEPERCIQCHACEVACKTWNSTDPGVRLRRFSSRFDGAYPRPKLVPATVSCLHCQNPACAAVCPVQAIARGADGIVRVDRSLCTGCRACLTACPVDAPQFGAEGRMVKCELCGGDPACVRACPTQALTLDLPAP